MTATDSRAGESEGEPGSDPLIRVLAAVIRQDDRWLLCQRPVHKRHGGLWEFPGGKLEPGEALLAAARRELGEELGVRVSAAGDVVYVRHDVGSPYVIEFVEVAIEGTPEPLEHDEVRWATLQQAAALPLAPADRDFLEDWLLPRTRQQPFR